MIRTCTIIVSHFESMAFLRACVRQLRKYRHPQILQKILIADQSSWETLAEIETEFGGQHDIDIMHSKSLYSGYGIDCAMRFGKIKTDYIAQLHVDAFPIAPNWLYLSIKLIEENNFGFVGQLHFISKPTDTIYPPGKTFFSMSPTFNVARTSTYKEMAFVGGFTRYHNRKEADLPMKWVNKDWDKWASEDYQNRGSDDDVPAFWWEGNYRNTNKLDFPVTGMIGISGEESGYGRIIGDIVFHFGFSCESKPLMQEMGEKYREWTRRINEGFDDKLIEEMLTAARAQPVYAKAKVWDSITKECSEVSIDMEYGKEELKNSK